MKKLILFPLILILAIIGIIMTFNEPIQNSAIKHLTNSALKQPLVSSNDNNPHKSTKREHYNYNSVKSVSPKMVSHAFFTHGNVIGIISLPSVKLKLPIYRGLDNDNLVKGAGTMKPHEQMGKGNYALAGHHMEDPHILFSPLQHAKVGNVIYLTNRSKKVYVYRITKKKVISKYQTGYIKDIGNRRVITLITCASGKPEEPNRIMIRGVLSSSN
ncbi:class A sortase [Lentilactobacillus hilgardii]|uniref:class A sortase n=1 Tax=Lentilactobacillus hilgardii TaxID=1588 RepID=UPI0021C26CB1|nr:class A sortase [Lentilactobacillus hilgardii]MCP9334284.1 class A sortase [Lentilactobacillus hilgardii]MCP9350663.1 class A sortase [Lentilactobacillus hilgardii]MCP9353556.1 class A sortase [Lentilactobacillus hilgardii]